MSSIRLLALSGKAATSAGSGRRSGGPPGLIRSPGVGLANGLAWLSVMLSVLSSQGLHVVGEYHEGGMAGRHDDRDVGQPLVPFVQHLRVLLHEEAEAEREKRAVIIKAEGDKIAAENLALAAKRLAEEPGAMHLRTLQKVNDLSSDQSNTTIWMLPVEIMDAMKAMGNFMGKK